ncbi:hypothetical protein K2X92_02340, partial [Candidatus Gracilibacteria bacterium]|nr:hypothetical protein [Candidatus Gracilibacteria bacterium]
HLSRKMSREIGGNNKKFGSIKNLKKNAVDDPRRMLFSMHNREGVANTYSTFGNQNQENALHQFNWEELLTGPLQAHLELTAENLSYELSLYYRSYLNRISRSSEGIKKFKQENPDASKEEIREQIYTITDTLFDKIFSRMGIPKSDYSLIHRDRENKIQAHIIINNVTTLNRLMEKRKFHGYI